MVNRMIIFGSGQIGHDAVFGQRAGVLLLR